MTTILTKKKDTAGAPVAGDLTNSAGGAELAVNTATKRLYTKDSGGNVVEIGTNPSSLDVPVIISGTTTSAALRITQLGTGDALLVEDSTNPDSSPFVIDASGQVVRGYTAPVATISYTAAAATPSIQNHGASVSGSSYAAFAWAANTVGPNFNFSKSRSATIGTPGIVSSGDLMGALTFAGDDGVGFILGASITSLVDGTPGTSDMPGRLVFSTTADGASTVTEAMRITSGQLVSVGTTQNAQSKLYVTNTVTDTASAEQGIWSILTANNASGTATKSGVRGRVTVGASYAGTGILTGFLSEVNNSLTTTIGGSFQAFRSSFTNSSTGTIGTIYSYASTPPSNASGTITNYYGFAQDDVTTATNVYGYLGSVTSGATKWNLYMSGTADNYLAGGLGIGSTSLTGRKVVVSGTVTGAVTSYGIYGAVTFQSDVTTHAYGIRSQGGTQAAAFTLPLLSHYAASQGTFGAGSTVTTQYGFNADSSLTGATNNYGFYGNIASGTGRYNFYAAGTADNYFAGNVGVGTTTPTSLLQTTGSSSESAFKTPNIAEVNTISATAATGTINYDITTQSVLYYTTNASGNFTVNFRGSSGTSLNTVMQTGESISATFLVTNGATAYYNSAVQVDGSSVTPKWQGGTAPTSGNASSIDSYTYVIIKTGSAAFTVLASVTKFA